MEENFRVSRATFYFLCTQLQSCLQRNYLVQMPLSVEVRVAIILYGDWALPLSIGPLIICLVWDCQPCVSLYMKYALLLLTYFVIAS